MLGTSQLVAPQRGYTLDPASPGASAGKTLARAYLDTVTENPADGDLEVWEVANLTGDVHPMHFHLVNVQVLARIPFSTYSLTSAGAFRPPASGRSAGPTRPNSAGRTRCGRTRAR
jgi:spore coat protein A, manganese oxidase